MRKEYNFKNGCTVTKRPFYNPMLQEEEWRYVVTLPDGHWYSTDSWAKAMEIVKGENK